MPHVHPWIFWITSYQLSAGPLRPAWGPRNCPMLDPSINANEVQACDEIQERPSRPHSYSCKTMASSSSKTRKLEGDASLRVSAQPVDAIIVRPLSRSTGMLERLPDSDDEEEKSVRGESSSRILKRGGSRGQRDFQARPSLAQSVPSLGADHGSPETLELYLSDNEDASDSQVSSSSNPGPSTWHEKRETQRYTSSRPRIAKQRPKAGQRSSTGFIEILDRTGSRRPPDETCDRSESQRAWSLPDAPTGISNFAQDVKIIGWKIVGLKDRLEDLGANGGVREKVGFGAYVGEHRFKLPDDSKLSQLRSAVYECEIETRSGSRIKRLRRYTDFETLRKTLRKTFPEVGYALPPLPAKSGFSRFEPAFLSKRQGRLESWLRTVLLHPLMGSSEAAKQWVLET